MNEFDRALHQQLEAVKAQGLYRELRTVFSAQGSRIILAGETLLNFSSNDYLGLANDPQLKAAAIEAINRYGAGTGASRLISGSLVPHRELDEAIADFKGTEAAVSFSTGYAAALGAICALLGKEDIVVVDKLVHASIVDAARLCGAKLRVFAHNDLNDLTEILQWADERHREATRVPTRPRVLIATESVFSMSGARAPLRELVQLKDKYGAWLMVDEAHATALYGTKGRGLAEELGVGDGIEIQMGTLGKALGAAGGYICGSRALIDYLINRARSLIFSTAPVPAAAAAATAGIRFVQSPAGQSRRELLWRRVAELNSGLGPPLPLFSSAIIPLPIGDETQAVEIATGLRRQGTYIPAIRYPTVARHSARLRLTLTAAHTSADIAQALEALKAVGLFPRCVAALPSTHAAVR